MTTDDKKRKIDIKRQKEDKKVVAKTKANTNGAKKDKDAKTQKLSKMTGKQHVVDKSVGVQKGKKDDRSKVIKKPKKFIKK